MYLSAKYIFRVNLPPLENGLLEINNDGTILNISEYNKIEHQNIDVQFFDGVLVPGFVNTHCHLELSHLRDRIPEQTGLSDFLDYVGNLKKDLFEKGRLIEEADQEMYNNGIVAVGDISNEIITKDIKEESKIFYHTFIELIALNPKDWKYKLFNGFLIQEQFGKQSSIVPHASYSVSEQLIKQITRIAEHNNHVVSIHNQETAEEDKFFWDKTGAIADFFKKIGEDISYFESSKKTSLQTILPSLSNETNLLLIHNVHSSDRDIKLAEEYSKNIYWCLCPNSNIYIEKKLPDVNLFIKNNCKITIGTDSLASNHKLNLLAEMKTLQSNFENLSFNQILEWATLNGAKSLNIADKFGSIEIGKKPGISLIENFDFLEMKLTKDSYLKKII